MTKKKPHSTTKKQFKFFVEEVKRFAKLCGLSSWSIRVLMEKIIKRDGSLDNSNAMIVLSSKGRWATIKLNSQNNYRQSDLALSQAALHEDFHVVLSPVEDLVLKARAGYQVSDGELDEVLESICRVVENLVFKSNIEAVEV